ncbi:hypothetical protein [Falsiruegeria mediterranea]|uniref:SIR2-like domain-containing protein n=1 Tax=Falsiruegeria mediterranea M17 TaxID=1200281 RepID=A0A2R8C581_9RHOB|nr:hypothetical protein [Falsiruegeria mediterranea]SPJ27577.1 hypothetical protein TRM7615_01067 [Falsiruegeria mediterranea M17]
MALQSAWDDSTVLSGEQKQLIHQCLPEEVIEGDITAAPQGEEQLDKLQRVLAACDEISKVEVAGGAGWLNETGRAFPNAIRSYFLRAAVYFHRLEHTLPIDFVTTLIDSVAGTGSHIATLNYDELLYRSFIGSQLFRPNHYPIDGFQHQFAEGNLERHRPTYQGYYLHLHGSPLYFTDGQGLIRKTNLAGVNALIGHSSTHLVLTHVAHKAAVIASSPLLRTYWMKLEEAMNESDAVVLFGYGGEDLHLNSLIGRYFRDKPVEIVTREKPAYLVDNGTGETARWQRKLNVSNVFLWRVHSLLDHRNWQWSPE